MKSKLLKNVLFNYIYEIFIILTPLVTTPYVSRVLGAGGVGTYSYTASLVTYFVTFSILGLSGYGLREVAFHRNDKKTVSQLFFEILLIKVVSVSFFLLAWLVFSYFYKSYTYCMIAFIPLLISNIFDIGWFYKGLEKFGYPVLVNVSVKLVSTIMIFVFIKNPTHLPYYITIIATSTLLGNIVMWIFVKKHLVRTKISSKSIVRHIKQSFVYFLPGLALIIYSVLDKTLIGLITSDSVQNGYYEQAHKIVNLVLVLCCGAINDVLNSRFSFLYGSGASETEIKKGIISGLNISLTLSVGCMFGLFAIAKIFVPLFFGEEFTAAVPLFLIFAPMPFICSFSNCLSSNYYTPSGRRKESAIYYMIAALINLLFNLLLIPFLGATGAAISTIISEIFISILLISKSRGMITFKECMPLVLKKMFAGLVMFVLLVVVSMLSTGSVKELLSMVFIGISVYFLVLLLLNDNSLKDMFSLLKNRKRF